MKYFIIVVSLVVALSTFAELKKTPKVEKITPKLSAQISPKSVSTNKSIIKSSVKATVSTNKPVATKELLKRLTTNDVKVLVATIKTIGNQDSGSKNVQAAFSKLLSHDSLPVKQAVVFEIYFFDSVKYMLPALEKCLHDPDEDIREDSIDVLAEIQTKEMMTILVNNLTNKYENVRDNSDYYLSFNSGQAITNRMGWVNWWSTNKTTFVFE